MNYKDIENKIYYHASQILNNHKPTKKFDKLGPVNHEKIKKLKNKSLVLKFDEADLEVISLLQGFRLVLNNKNETKKSWLEGLSLQGQPEPKEPNYDVQDRVLSLNLNQGGLKICFDLAKGRFQIIQKECLVFNNAFFSRAGSWWRMEAAVSKELHWLGLGEKTGRLYKNPGFWKIWNTDECDMDTDKDPLYQAAPYIAGVQLGGQAIGFYFDNPGYSDFKYTEDKLVYSCQKGVLSFYILMGPDIKSLCSQLAEIKGFSPLPPYWSLGYHHSRWEPEESEEKVLKLAEEFEKHQLPVDVFHLDIGHLDDFRCFKWHPQRFPHPSGVISRLNQSEINTLVITDPGLKRDKNWNVFQKALEKKLFCQNKQGRTLFSKVWPGPVSLIDFFKAESCEFWGDLYKDYIQQGIKGFWIDMNEPALFDFRRTLGPDCYHQTDLGQVSHQEVHNLYGHMMAKATFEGVKKHRPQKRPFILSRSAFMGTEKYACTWTGDNKSEWEHLRLSIPMLLNMGISGQAMIGPDIGGFLGDAEKELFVRWMEMGRFYPFCRNHRCAGTRSQEPWTFDEETLEAVKHCLLLRYSLLPYFYTAFYEASVRGIPLMRPLFMEFPQDKMLYEQQIGETEFLLGNSLLIAPILGPGLAKRPFYLPKDSYWYNYYTNDFLKGGTIHSVSAPLGKTPFFIKAGTALFQVAPQTRTTKAMKEDLICTLYLAPQIQGDLYLDDGDGYGYLIGECSVLEVSGRLTENSLELSVLRIKGNESYPAFGKHGGLKIYIPDPLGPSISDVLLLDESKAKTISYEKQNNYLIIDIDAQDLPLYMLCRLS